MSAIRERWHYAGREPTGPDGVDCYRWVRYLDKPTPEGYLKWGCALPVATFWPAVVACTDNQPQEGSDDVSER